MARKAEVQCFAKKSLNSQSIEALAKKSLSIHSLQKHLMCLVNKRFKRNLIIKQSKLLHSTKC